MGYKIALEKAWAEIENLTEKKKFNVKMLADEYDIDLENRRILSLGCNTQVKEYIQIILLHYLIQKLKLKALPLPSGEWVEFRQLEGGDAYYSVFKNRVIDVILRKYGKHPESILNILKRFPAKKEQIGDVGVVIQIFEGVPLLITLYRADEEFAPEANIFFDKNINRIFCTEDIVVLTESVVHLL